MMPTILYIIAISLQFAGAIILVKRFNPIKARAFIFKSIEEDKEKGGTDFGEFDEEGQFRIVEKEILQAKAEEIYLNGLAFGYIAIGYVLGIFGEIHCNKYIIAAFVVALAILLMGAGTWICRHCAEKNFPEDIQVRDS
ncbi:MAG: hypothetical protein SO401_09370 [Blautia sp.]|nr:hypothetical protein [Blautia sp.]